MISGHRFHHVATHAALLAMMAIGLTCGAAQAEAQTATGDRAKAAGLARDSGVRLVRFTGSYDGTVADRGNDPHYRPTGRVTAGRGDKIISGNGAMASIVYSNVDGKGGFIDRGTIEFPAGRIEFEGVYPTHNDTTPVPALRQTAMVQQVKGGTGAFEGATGYLMIISTLVERAPRLTAFNGTIAGVLFVKVRK